MARRKARGNAKKPEKALYTAIFLDDPDSLKRWWVDTTGIPLLPKHYSHHMTIKFKPEAQEVVNLPIGKPVLLRIVGWAADAKGQAVEVESSVGSTNRIAHITVATDGTSPVYSNTLLAEGVTPANGVLEGSVGYQSTKGREVFDLTGTIYDKKARENPTEAECDERVRRALSRKKKKAKAPTWESPTDFPAMPSFARPSSRFIVGGSQVTTIAKGNPSLKPGSTIRHFHGSSVIWRVVDLSFADTESYGEPVWIIEQIAGKTKRKSPRTLKQSTADLYYVDAESAPVKTIYRKNPGSYYDHSGDGMRRAMYPDPQAPYIVIVDRRKTYEYARYGNAINRAEREARTAKEVVLTQGGQVLRVWGDGTRWNPKSSKKEFVEQAWAKRAHRLPAHDYEPRKGLEGPFQYPSGNRERANTGIRPRIYT